MKTTATLIALLMFFVLVFSGCTGAVVSCQTIYNECEDSITADEDDFVDDCVDEYFDEDSTCRDAVRDFAKCVSDNGCDDPACIDDYFEIANDCGVDALQIAFGK